MRNILITGLGIGKEFGVCGASNMEYSELLRNSHVLLWADKILIPNHDYFRNDFIGREEKLVFSILEKEGLISRYNVSKEINYENTFDNFSNEAAIELKKISELNKDNVEIINNSELNRELLSDKYLYCVPRVASINSAMFLADELDANCLFSAYDEHYLKLKYKMYDKGNISVLNEIYKEILSVDLTNESIIHAYGTYKGCNNCKKEKICNDSYLNDVEKALYSILQIRNHDEIAQLRMIIDEIFEKKSELLIYPDENEIINDIRIKKYQIEKRINLLFPKVTRFANVVTSISLPISLLSNYLDDKKLSLVSGSIAGISTIITKYLDNYKNKNNWINFVDKNNQGKCKK